MPDFLPPQMPVFDPTATNAILKGFEGLAANRRYAQQLDYEFQKLATDAQLQQDQHAFEREKLVQELPLQQAQMENYYADARSHDAQTKYIEETKGQLIKDRTAAEAALPDFNKTIAQIPITDWGTQNADAAIANAMQDYSQITQSPLGIAAMKAVDVRQRMAKSQLASVNLNMVKQYNQIFQNKGINDPGIGGFLELDNTGKPVPNNVWGRNDDGTAFVALKNGVNAAGQPVLGAGGIIPPDQASKLKPEEKTFATFSKSDIKNILAMRSRIQKWRDGTRAASPDAIDSAVQQHGQQQSAEDNNAAAIQWVKDNPNDPRTPQIRNLLGLAP